MSNKTVFCGSGLRRTAAPQRGRERLMMRNLAARLAAFIAIALAYGCGAARPVKYYQLTIPADRPTSAETAQYPVTLLIGPLKASHLYREDRIVYGSSGEQMGTYEQHRWAEPPTEMIGMTLLHTLRAGGHFQSVIPLMSNAQGDFLLRGQLYDFKEVSGSALAARLTLELEMRDIKAGQTVWTHYYTHDEPVGGKDVPTVVAALNRNVHRAEEEVSSSLNQYFAAHPPK
jgi:ABC-type uncharacterized transport system auxiliary subunit